MISLMDLTLSLFCYEITHEQRFGPVIFQSCKAHMAFICSFRWAIERDVEISRYKTKDIKQIYVTGLFL